MENLLMQSNSAKRKLREQLLRRIQVSAMQEQFREIGADRSTIKREDPNAPKHNTTFAESETMVDWFTAKRAKYRMSPIRTLREELPCAHCHKYSKYCECE
jgi:hypothetical protein